MHGLSLTQLLQRVRACDVCAAQLPLGPRPIVQASSNAALLIIGQAPGAKVHASGVPWDDASGDRLREWLGLDEQVFYSDAVALLPMGLCYPGRGKSGDLGPRPECQPLWHPALLEQLSKVQLTLLIGAYAQAQYLPHAEKTLTATVKNFRTFLPQFLPLPHPSPRNNIWLKKNPWFEQDVLPILRAQIAQAGFVPSNN